MRQPLLDVQSVAQISNKHVFFMACLGPPNLACRTAPTASILQVGEGAISGGGLKETRGTRGPVGNSAGCPCYIKEQWVVGATVLTNVQSSISFTINHWN